MVHCWLCFHRIFGVFGFSWPATHPPLPVVMSLLCTSTCCFPANIFSPLLLCFRLMVSMVLEFLIDFKNSTIYAYQFCMALSYIISHNSHATTTTTRTTHLFIFRHVATPNVNCKNLIDCVRCLFPFVCQYLSMPACNKYTNMYVCLPACLAMHTHIVLLE